MIGTTANVQGINITSQYTTSFDEKMLPLLSSVRVLPIMAELYVLNQFLQMFNNFREKYSCFVVLLTVSRIPGNLSSPIEEQFTGTRILPTRQSCCSLFVVLFWGFKLRRYILFLRSEDSSPRVSLSVHGSFEHDEHDLALSRVFREPGGVLAFVPFIPVVHLNEVEFDEGRTRTKKIGDHQSDHPLEFCART